MLKGIEISKNGATVTLVLARVHLSAPRSTSLPARYGKRIKDLGGSYSDIRGHKDRRYVYLPLQNHDSTVLIDELIRQYGLRSTTVVFEVRRNGSRENVPSWVLVQYIFPGDGEKFQHAVDKARDALGQAVERGITKTDEVIANEMAKEANEVAKRRAAIAREEREIDLRSDMVALIRAIAADVEGVNEVALRCKAKALVARLDVVNRLDRQEESTAA